MKAFLHTAIGKDYRQFQHYIWPLLLYFFSTFTFANSALSNNVQAQTQVLAKQGKILIIISSDQHGFWLPEVLEPYRLLADAGYAIDIASPLGGDGYARGVSRLSKEQQNWFNNADLKQQLQQTKPLSAVVATAYLAVYFAGGSGPMFDLVNNKQAMAITRDIYEAGGIVSADCHGPAALINVTLANGQRLIAGKKLTAKANIEEGSWARNNYPFLLEDKIADVGGLYSAKGKNQVHVVVDRRLITGQNPASALPMAKRLLAQLAKRN
ncbi:type 1 glutamine amidotransferase domain-containing protein [Thalassotalea sp. ND16A]|uniref:type 1 glutamine amidotransferase domain-containing protein n=1 Tax=Thalassotalea sp. ND16A TaxID=1535422 RepID=UPI00051DDCD7|nr:type 1 glutamine amidotransferase domain-containing protein [Thalassotalea sp. ND16A]KGJ90537.1 hypothetical protein ND16A_1933 [Thalassotalea sp. ND16A]